MLCDWSALSYPFVSLEGSALPAIDAESQE
jgi:hypothetical protein